VEVDADIKGFASNELTSSDGYDSEEAVEDMDDGFVGDSDYYEDDDTSDGMVKCLQKNSIGRGVVTLSHILSPS